MEIFVLLTTILQMFAISLGVGSSTLAIINFFVAISDGKIDDTERRMMGIVYVVLRVAMVSILLTTLVLVLLEANGVGFGALAATTYATLIVLAILFLNAILMTIRIMPSTFGPGIQAGSWYALGALAALISQGITTFSLGIFALSYLTWLVLAVGLVNGTMAILRAKRHGVIT